MNARAAGFRGGTDARYGECASCGQPFERFDSPGGIFRSHLTHPEDGHEVALAASN